MAKKVKKKSDYLTAYFFDANENPANWPPMVQVNPLSPTGYSYGTMARSESEMHNVDPEISYPVIDGFIIKNLTWIIQDENGLVSNITQEEYDKTYIDA